MGDAILATVRLEETDCCVCGVAYAMPVALLNARRSDGKSFWCPSGHSQSYTESTEAKLRKQLEQETKRKEWAEQQAKKAEAETKVARHALAIANGKAKATAERIKNGVCPCCKRHFTNLERHMNTKHPHYAEPEPEPK